MTCFALKKRNEEMKTKEFRAFSSKRTRTDVRGKFDGC